jgi:hypothetical protein
MNHHMDILEVETLDTIYWVNLEHGENANALF